MEPAQDQKFAGAAPPGSADEPMSLRAQIGAVRDAIRRLLTAHIELGKAEIGEISAEIGRVAVLGGIAFVSLLLLGLLLPIGGLLFLGEWLLGSIGWGVLLGSVLLLDLALILILVALGVPAARVARDLLIAVLIAVGVATVVLLLSAGVRVAIGLGLFTMFVAWPTLVGIGAARGGITTEALKSRFYPTQTIETTKETIEWVRERTPLGRKS